MLFRKLFHLWVLLNVLNYFIALLLTLKPFLHPSCSHFYGCSFENCNFSFQLLGLWYFDLCINEFFKKIFFFYFLRVHFLHRFLHASSISCFILKFSTYLFWAVCPSAVTFLFVLRSINIRNTYSYFSSGDFVLVFFFSQVSFIPLTSARLFFWCQICVG